LGFNQPRHALAELTKNPQRIDALISDLAMPGMTGFDVAREAFALRPDLPIIVVSGYIRPQDATTAHALGVQRMILKPDTVDALAAALHEVLEASERVNAS
jgi:CheY-like chemotaxis protein